MSAAQRSRPRDDSAAAIRRTLAQLADDRTAAEARIVTGTERRGALLVSGTLADISAIDEAVRQTRLEIERTDARIADLAPKLAAAIGREKIAHIETLRADAEAATGRFDDFWHRKYEAPAREIAAGLELERVARIARAAYAQAAAEAADDADVQAAGGVADRTMPALPVAGGGRSPSTLVCLPGIGLGAPAIAWPAGRTLVETKAGAASAYS